MIEVKAVHKSFGSFEALHGVSMALMEGEVVSIIGPSGSGKSTLLRCMNLLEVPTKGNIFVDGVDITDPKTDIQKERLKIGMVFQEFNLFPHMTVVENMIYAPVKIKKMPKEQATEKAFQLLKRVGISEKIKDYPRSLSGGQKQRVAIARALIMEPEYMLFDEPTSALDPEMIKEVLMVIKDLAFSGTTMALVTHEMGFCREVSKRVCFLDGGRILEDVPAKEFFANPQGDRAKEFLDKML